MRITFVLPNWSSKPIGGYKVVYEYANHLVIRGHRVCVIHPLLLSPQETDLKQKVKFYLRLVKYLIMKIKKLKWFRISPEVGMLIVPNLKEKYIPYGDVIVATAWQTAEWVNQYAPDKGEKYYLIQHYEIWSGNEKRVEATLRFPLKKIVISKWLKRMVEEMGEKVEGYIPNGLDFNHFRIMSPPENRNPRVVGMLYSKIDWKGSEDGIKALILVKQQVPDLQAIFFGVSSRGKDIPNWVEYHQNPESDKLLDIYNRCSIYLGSSWYEGWFLPGAEALACGCALVTTDSLGIREYAIHEKTALISQPKDPHELAQNIVRLIQNNNLRSNLSKNGHLHVQRFTWEKAVDLFEKVVS